MFYFPGLTPEILANGSLTCLHKLHTHTHTNALLRPVHADVLLI